MLDYSLGLFALLVSFFFDHLNEIAGLLGIVLLLIRIGLGIREWRTGREAHR